MEKAGHGHWEHVNERYTRIDANWHKRKVIVRTFRRKSRRHTLTEEWNWKEWESSTRRIVIVNLLLFSVFCMCDCCRATNRIISKCYSNHKKKVSQNECPWGRRNTHTNGAINYITVIQCEVSSNIYRSIKIYFSQSRIQYALYFSF